MTFPLGTTDISLLLAVVSIVLLITSEFLSPYYGTANLKISKKRLRYAALTTSTLFLVTVTVRVITIVYRV